MANFSNIAPDDKNPIILDIDAIAAVADHGDHFVLYSREQGRIYESKGRKNAPTTADVLDKLQAAGFEMAILPCRFRDSDIVTQGTYHVRPDAFTYFVASDAYTPENETELHRNALLGLEGYRYGQLENIVLTLPQTDKLLDVLQRHNKNLFTVDPQTATSRYQESGITVFNPEKLTKIVYEDSGRLGLQFGGGGFGLKLRDTPDINAVYQEMLQQNPGVGLAQVGKRQKELAENLRTTFLRAIKSQAPQLQEFKGALRSSCWRFKNISQIFPFTDRDGTAGMTLYFNDSAGQAHAPRENVYFQSEADMRTALDDFIAFRNAKPPAP